MIKKTFMLGILVLIVFLNGCSNDSIDNVKTNGKGEFLPVEKAFVFSINSIDKNTVNAHWDIADGYHLYKDKFEFSLGNEDYQIASLDMPKGKMIEDKVFGNKESYSGSLDVKITLKTMNASGKVSVTTGYQGCSEKGLCYPPQSVMSEIAL